MNQLPVAIFAYNRPSHLKRLLISLEGSNIHCFDFFLDGPKNEKDKLIQDQIIFMIKNSHFKTTIVRHKKNLGLANSLEFGLNYMSKKYNYFVILEDDIVPFKAFFKFVKLNLDKFKDEDNIAAICVYQFNEINKIRKTNNSSVVLDFFIPWGWATWSKKWIDYKLNKNNIFIKNKIYNKSYIVKFLKNIIKKKPKDIWSANYILYNILRDKKFIFPTSTLIKNIGLDGSGINSKVTNDLYVTENKKLKENFEKIRNANIFQEIQYKVLKKKINLFY